MSSVLIPSLTEKTGKSQLKTGDPKLDISPDVPGERHSTFYFYAELSTLHIKQVIGRISRTTKISTEE